MYAGIALCCISPTTVFIAKSKWSIIVKYIGKTAILIIGSELSCNSPEAHKRSSFRDGGI